MTINNINELVVPKFQLASGVNMTRAFESEFSCRLRLAVESLDNHVNNESGCVVWSPKYSLGLMTYVPDKLLDRIEKNPEWFALIIV